MTSEESTIRVVGSQQAEVLSFKTRLFVEHLSDCCYTPIKGCAVIETTVLAASYKYTWVARYNWVGGNRAGLGMEIAHLIAGGLTTKWDFGAE